MPTQGRHGESDRGQLTDTDACGDPGRLVLHCACFLKAAFESTNGVVTHFGTDSFTSPSVSLVDRERDRRVTVSAGIAKTCRRR